MGNLKYFKNHQNMTQIHEIRKCKKKKKKRKCYWKNGANGLAPHRVALNFWFVKKRNVRKAQFKKKKKEEVQ